MSVALWSWHPSATSVLDSAYLDEDDFVAISGANGNRRDELRFGRALTYAVLRRHCECNRACVRVRREPGAKPSAVLCRSLDFSTSHAAGRHVVGVLVGTGIIGVDLEVPRPSLAWQPVARRVFSRNEQAWVASQADSCAGFFRVWTMKEAVVKATGDGLRRLRSVEVVRDGKLVRRVMSAEGPSLHVRTVTIGNAIVAVASSVGDPITIHHVPAQELP